MPKIYLSPSTQEWNQYITQSGSEELQMNLLADALEPYLRSCAIVFVRNKPEMTAASSIRQSNAIGGFDLHLALHSNAAGAGSEGTQRGIIGFYYPTSRDGERAAQEICDELKKVYPLPDKVTTRATTTLGEVRQPRAPSVLLEIGYHDNYADAQWVETHRTAIAQAIAMGLADYFGIPFIYPMAEQTGVITTSGGALLLRTYPSATATVAARIPNGAQVQVYGAWEGWYVVHYSGAVGYAAAAYISL
ncbi:MAG: N-acetylmuramoyl-L-alanine amidase [Oscillospiraceae bacterium]|nr:N-acetylmuramoyl-L-alanine amidase [Oscillospiraceae bacterium]